MTRTGDREIHSVSGRLPDNLGELAYMLLTVSGRVFLTYEIISKCYQLRPETVSRNKMNYSAETMETVNIRRI